MSLTNQFSKKLDDLWKRRTVEVRALVIPRDIGQPKKFSSVIKKQLIDDLLECATTILVKKEGKKEFNRVTSKRKLRKINGHGLLDRGNKLVKWAKFEFNGPIVYAFWRRQKCLYVGKGASWKRLRNYKKSAYLRDASHIEVFGIHGKSHLGKAECLAAHLFNPRDNEYKPAKFIWGKVCPICEKHDQIYDELHLLFKMR